MCHVGGLMPATKADGGGSPDLLGLALQAAVCGGVWFYRELDVCRIQWCRWLGAGRPVTTATTTTAVTGAREVTETGLQRSN